MYRAYLVETTTGRVAGALPLLGDPSISITLNEIESISITTTMEAYRRHSTWWVRPYSASILVTYDGIMGERPLAAGPIISFPSITPSSIKIEAKGLRHIFERRFLARAGAIRGQKDIKFTGLSYGAIAQEVVRLGMKRPNGTLPIAWASPYEKTDRERTYEPWNVSNLAIDDVLTKLSEVINGPAIMFKPRWAEGDKSAIEWAMLHGTHDNPHIHQKRVPDFDLMGDVTQVLDFSLQSSGANLVHRVIGTGAGEGAGTVIVEAENQGMVSAGMPYLEATFSDSQIEEAQKHLLERDARERVREGQRMIDQLSLTIPVDHPKNPCGSWDVGMYCNVWTPDMLFIPQGKHQLRIIAASWSGDTVNIELQEFKAV